MSSSKTVPADLDDLLDTLGSEMLRRQRSSSRQLTQRVGKLNKLAEESWPPRCRSDIDAAIQHCERQRKEIDKIGFTQADNEKVESGNFYIKYML